MKYKKIPSSYKLGGQTVEVRDVERCDGNCVGTCSVSAGIVEIAEKFNKDHVQSPTSKVNTFYHELTHSILGTMGENELDENEKFVCCFSSLLADAMEKAYFIEEDKVVARKKNGKS